MRRLRPRSTVTPVPDPAEASQVGRHDGGPPVAKAPGPRRSRDAAWKSPVNRPSKILFESIQPLPFEALFRPTQQSRTD